MHSLHPSTEHVFALTPTRPGNSCCDRSSSHYSQAAAGAELCQNQKASSEEWRRKVDGDNKGVGDGENCWERAGSSYSFHPNPSQGQELKQTPAPTTLYSNPK